MRKGMISIKPLRLPFCVVRFTLQGLNLERFMNTLEKERIPLLWVRRQEARVLHCRCYAVDLPAVRAVAEEKGWRIRDAEPVYLSAWLKKLRQRPGLPVGAALSLLLLLTALQFVWRVEIHGAGPYRAEIAAFLKQEGFGPGKPKGELDAEALENRLAARYPQVAWFHAYVYNVSLVVDCTLGVPLPAPPSVQPGDVVASRDGVIDTLLVYAGTPVAKPGDVVQKGQVLIRGAERGENEQLVPVRARGVATARCWRTHRVEMPVFEVISGETGREDAQQRLSTPFLRWPEPLDEPPFLGYNTYLSAVPVGGVFFPIYRETVTRREVWMERRPRDLEAVKKEAAEAALRQLKKSLRGYEIVDKWVDYCMIEDDTLAASATAEWLMDIGETAP